MAVEYYAATDDSEQTFGGCEFPISPGVEHVFVQLAYTMQSFYQSSRPMKQTLDARMKITQYIDGMV